MHSPSRALVFDAVGTLFYADPPVATVYSDVACGFGIAIEADEVRLRFATAMKTLPSLNPLDEDAERRRWIERVRFVFDGAPAERFDELFAALWKRFADHAAWRLYADVERALEMARDAGFRVAVASNFDARLHAIVDALLPRRFECILPATQLGAAKPDPKFFREVEARLATPGERIVLFGDDSHDDGAGATAAGWSYRLVSSDPKRRRPEEDASLVKLVAELTNLRGRTY